MAPANDSTAAEAALHFATELLHLHVGLGAIITEFAVERDLDSFPLALPGGDAQLALQRFQLRSKVRRLRRVQLNDVLFSGLERSRIAAQRGAMKLLQAVQLGGGSAQ